jgi:HSP20 family protein
MELMKWNPPRELFSSGNRMRDLFDDFFYPLFKEESTRSIWGWNPKVDVYEEDGRLIFKAELPGVEKKDIEVTVKDAVLTLKGERSADNEVKDKEKNYYRRERSSGKFVRSFNLPAEVNPENIEADYKDGILKVSVPKPEKLKTKQITVH